MGGIACQVRSAQANSAVENVVVGPNHCIKQLWYIRRKVPSLTQASGATLITGETQQPTTTSTESQIDLRP